MSDEKKSHDDLLARFVEASKEVDVCKDRFLSKKKELMDTETLLVNAREIKIKAEEDLYKFETTQIMGACVDDVREAQIDDYRKRMPELMKRIENERPIPYKMASELDTIGSWPIKK